MIQTENNSKLNDSLVDQHEKSNQWSIKTQELLEDLVHNSEINETMQNNMESLFEKISEEQQRLNENKQEYIELLKNSIVELKSYWNDNKTLLLENSTHFTELNSMLNESMNDFADHMQRGVQATFKQFDEQLKKAVQYLERGVNGIQQVVESMEQDIDNIDGQINRFNKALEKISIKAEV